MFEDRKDAGLKLAAALEKYKDQGALVLGIPRGGVEIGYYVALHLNAELSIIVTRKLPFPDDPEAGFGAIAEDGSTFFFEHYKRLFPQDVLERIIQEQSQEVRRRVSALRGGRPLPRIQARTVIITDDGIAMGSTMAASIKLCRNKKAKKIIAAAPVSATDTAEEIAAIADEVVILEKPPYFRAVAQAYRHWYDVSDKEVIEILQRK